MLLYRRTERFYCYCVMRRISQVLLGYVLLSFSSDVVSLVEEVVSREPLVADRREQVHGLITSETPFAVILLRRL